MLSEGKRRLVFFDVDNVLIKGQSQKFLIYFLFKKGLINFRTLLKVYLWFALYRVHFIQDTLTIRRRVFASFAGFDVLTATKLMDEFFKRQIIPRIYPQALGIIQQHLAQKDEIILVSASLAEIVERLKDYLGLKFAMATTLEKKEGRYTGEILGAIPYGVNKVLKIEEFLKKEKNFTLEDSYAYADHISDLPLLELVAHPVVVNPDKKLRKIARRRKWRIYDF